MSESLQPKSPGQNTGVSSLSLLQRIFPTQESNPGLLHCRQILYQLNHKESPRIMEWVAYLFSSGSFWLRNRTRVSCIAGIFFTNWAIREVLVYSAYKLNNQGDNIQPWCTPFPIWNQSIVPCPVLTCFLTCIQVSQEAGKVVLYSSLFKNFPQFVVIHTVKGFGVIKKEVGVFLELSHFFCNLTDVSNLKSCDQPR